MALNFNGAPYYDDYSPNKGFLKILFKPGQAVQARELTQSQDILQNQISSFGSFVFQSGSPVLGGQITLDLNITYANLQPLYQNTSVNVTQFLNNIVTDVATQTVRASVVTAIPPVPGTNNPPTLMLKYLTGTTFANGANITIAGSTTGPFALLSNTNSQGTGSVVNLANGIFFLNLSNLNPVANSAANTVNPLTNAYFVNVPAQTVVLDPYDNTPTYMVGLQVSDAIVTEQTDSSLLDPALGSTNYQAPGAARYIINTTLSTRSLTSLDTSAFVNLLTIQNGQLQTFADYPQLADLNNTLAQRTQETNGNFTVSPFNIQLLDTANNDIANANSQIYYAALGPGLAYVQGYRYQTISKTYLTAPRARTYANVSNYLVQDYYGNYLLVDTVRGEFNISTLPVIDIHCVQWDNVNTVTTNAYANTLIGYATLRAFEYVSDPNSANALSYVYRAHLCDVNTGSFVSNVVFATANTIQFGPLFNSATNAYSGMVINIPFTGDQRLITSYNGSTQTATVNAPWSVNPANGNTFQIITNIISAESIGANGNNNFATANANINIGSKNLFSPYQNVSFTDANFLPLIFNFPNQYIVPGLSGSNYQYRYRVATGQTLTSNTPLVITLSVPGDASATFAAAGISGSDLISLSDFLVVQNPGAGGGNTIPMISTLGRSIATTPTTATLTTSASDPSFTNVDVFASVKTTIGARTKTLVTANTNTVQSSGGTTVGPSTVYASSGQIYFTTPGTSNLCTPGISQDLYICDGISVIIIDSGNIRNAVTNAMLQAAANNLSIPGGGINITNNYTFFNGQKDTHYAHSSITLNPGAPAPKGQVLVALNYFSHSTTGGYFTVDSYPTYSLIPSYQSLSGPLYFLRDCIDFRPRKNDATTTSSYSNMGTILLPEPIPGEGFTTNFAYYLPRIDLLALTKNGIFTIVQGTASLNPAAPKQPSNSMLLYTLNVPPYTANAANITPIMQNNRRYTMADIGNLDARISQLEYYATLNAQEQDATTTTLTDSNGVTRPFNGILVDTFSDFTIANVLAPDYYAAIDTTNQVMRPPFQTNNVPLNFNASLSSNYTQNGNFFTLPYTIKTLISQPLASRAENLNPFNITTWLGQIQLNPESDTWYSTQLAPNLISNVGDSYTSGNTSYNIVWNNWVTTWSGIVMTNGAYVPSADFITNVTTATPTIDQTRTGTQTTTTYQNLVTYAGTNVINTNIIPVCRSNYITFVAQGMLPLDNVYAFFDGINVSNYTQPINTITFTAPIFFQDNYQNGEQITDTDGNTNGGLGANSAQILYVKGNTAYVYGVIGVIYPGKIFQGSITGNTGTVLSYNHYSGTAGEPAGLRYQTKPYTTGVTSLANANTIVLQGSAANTDGYYVGNTIYIASGDGSGSSSVISAYNGASRIATVNPPWNVTLTTPTTETFYYGIGQLQTDLNGDIAGAFYLPSNQNISFPTGTNIFLLSDSPQGNVATAKSKAQDNYTAQGFLNTVQNDYVSTRVPTVTTSTVQQTQVISGDPVTVAQTTVNAGGSLAFQAAITALMDPLAQTFFIDNQAHPDGVFITSVRVCFVTSDPLVPVTIQIRPTVNGYPDASNILPFSEVTLLPSQVNLTTSPSLTNAGQYTEFFFDAPLYLLPGMEYAIVLLSDSNHYEILAAAVGDLVLGSNQLIQTPPYIGSLFKSQNSSTWTAAQGESLMFGIMAAQFNTNHTMTLTFNAPAHISNTPFSPMPSSEFYADLFFLTNQDQLIRDTTLAYGYRATGNTSRILDSTYTSVIPNQNTVLLGNRRVLLPTGNAFYLQTSATSINSDVSPLVDAERYSLIAVSNQINTGGFGNGSITIANTGMGYNIANTNLITVNGGNGSGAQLAIGSVDANGNITSVYVPTNGYGTQYSTTPNVSVTTSGYTPTVNAFITLAGETGTSGGNFLSRYITRMVTLASGMDAGDIEVIVDVHKPSTSQIYVYYKILSAEDTSTFASRPWTLMALDGTDSFSTGTNDFTEYTYVGSLNQYGNPVNSISYGQYTSFKYFAIKIDMEASDPTNPPLVSNLRIFCMPAAS